MPHKAIALILAAMAWPSAGTAAGTENPGTPLFSLGGFGTFGVVRSSEDHADFAPSIFNANGAGYTRKWSAAVDSRIGAQVAVNLTSKFSAILQVISEQNYDGTFTPHVEWANIKYQFTPDVSVRVGRTVLPSFLFSDTRKVGYTIAWARLPVEVYSLVPVANSDGVDASYRVQIGDFTHTVVGAYGRTETTSPNGYDNDATHQWVITDTVEHGAARFRITYQEARLTVGSLDALFNAFRSFGPQGNALADKYGPHEKPLELFLVGGIYDPLDWFVAGEWGTCDFHSVLGKITAWYLSGGYRLGKFTPYVSFAQLKNDANKSDPGLTVSALPPFLSGPAMGLNGALNSILGSAPDQRTISVGGRWDLMKDVALKLQFDHSRLGAGSSGVLINVQPGFQPGGTVNLITAAIDFVF
jgi:hypothetical protein